MFLLKAARSTVLCARERSDPHQVHSLRTKSCNPEGAHSASPSKAPYQHHQNPSQLQAAWEIIKNVVIHFLPIFHYIGIEEAIDRPSMIVVLAQRIHNVGRSLLACSLGFRLFRCVAAKFGIPFTLLRFIHYPVGLYPATLFSFYPLPLTLYS